MAIPGAASGTPATTNDVPSIASLKKDAKSTLAAHRNAAAMNLISTGKKAIDAGIVKEGEGNLQAALLKYYQAAQLLSYAMDSSEYKAEDHPGKHGAVYHQTVQFADYFRKTAQPRIGGLETRLQELESSRSGVDYVAAPGAPNGTSGKARLPTPVRRTTDDDGPVETSGGSLADRMRKLRGAGLDMTTVSQSTGASKRLSHQSNPSTSSMTSLRSPVASRAPPSADATHIPSEASDSARNSSTDTTPRRLSQLSLAPQTTPSTSPSYSSTSFPGPGNPSTPGASPRLQASEVRKQATGTNGISSSPRHRNLQSLATSDVASYSVPPAISEPPPDLSLDSAVTPSISTFKSNFPSIEDLDLKYGPSSHDGLPSVPEGNLPLFPSVPSSQPSSSSTRSARSPSIDVTKKPDIPVSTKPSPRPPSASSVPLRLQHSGSSSQGSPRSPTLGSGTPPSRSFASGGPLTAKSAGKRPDIPLTTGITPTQLRKFLDPETGGGVQVLLLDVRSQQRHEEERIDGPNSVWLDPIVLSRADVNISTVESSLVLSPREEEELFRNRENFDIVVIYDDTSTVFIQALQTLSRLIYQPELIRTLQRQPMLLIGGIKRWRTELGTVGLIGTAIAAATQSSTQGTGSSAPNGRSRAESASSNGYKSPAPEATSYSKTGAEIYAEERDRRRRAHVRDGAVFEHPPGTSDKTRDELKDADNHGDGASVVRRSTLVRPSSSGTISAYNRPLVDTSNGGIYANHVPITYPSRVMSPTTQGSSQPSSFAGTSPYLNGSIPTPPAVAAPPPASLGDSPLARRRSDYVEQSLYTYSGISPGPSRASIDYPSLSIQHVVRPPPPVASNSMERQEQRPRGHLPPVPLAPSPNDSLFTVIGKLSIPTPPMIQCNYSVVYWADTRIGMSGLRNLGNTCYMNSVIQCLSATVPFARFFIDGRWKSAVNMQNPLGTKGAVASAFRTIIYELWSQQSTYLVPHDFRKRICSYAPQFGGSDQHDAQEFLSFLLDGLHEDLNRIIRKPSIPSPTSEREKELETLPQQIAGAQEWQLYRLRDDSIVVDYFQGQFRNRLQCLTCNHTSTTYNTFMPLSLPIPTGRGVTKVTLDACLQAFVAPEILDKGDAWKCPNCKTLRKASKQLSLSRLPPVLLIHLKRFSFKGPFTDKLETMVDFPLKNLDLTNYMPPLLPPNDDKGGLYTQRAYSPDDPRLQVPPYKYELYAVTNHFGTLSSGHYTSFIASDGGWSYCDDSRIAPADPKDVVGRPAYLLYYRRVKAT